MESAPPAHKADSAQPTACSSCLHCFWPSVGHRYFSPSYCSASCGPLFPHYPLGIQSQAAASQSELTTVQYMKSALLIQLPTEFRISYGRLQPRLTGTKLCVVTIFAPSVQSTQSLIAGEHSSSQVSAKRAPTQGSWWSQLPILFSS